MRLRHSLLSAAALACAVGFAIPAHADFRTPRVSQNANVSQTIGTTDLSIKYSRPGVKGRAIWGGLVPFDKPWRTGANEVTAFTTSDDIKVEDQPLPAGTYGFVTIPGAEKWTIIFSKQKDMWGAFSYDSTHDQLRVSVKPQPAEMQEWMQFALDITAPDSCELALRWEKLRVPVRIHVDVIARVLREARAAVDSAKADDWRTPYRAANWANDNGVAPTDVATWAAAALKLKENFSTLSLAAKLAQKAGNQKVAIAQMTRAIALGKADKDVEAVQIAPMEKLLADWSATK